MIRGLCCSFPQWEGYIKAFEGKKACCNGIGRLHRREIAKCYARHPYCGLGVILGVNWERKQAVVGREKKQAGGKGEIDLMLMQCGLSNSIKNWGTKSLNCADFPRYSKNEMRCLTGIFNAEYGRQLAFAFSPLRGLTTILIPDRALLAAYFVTGPLLFTR